MISSDAESVPSFDPTTLAIQRELVHESPILACRYSPDGNSVAASAQDNRTLLWRLDSDAKLVMAGHESWVNALQFSADGSRLVTGGCDGRLVWWDLTAAEPTPLKTVQAHSGWVRSLALSPDGQTLASASNDLSVKLWSMDSSDELRVLSGHTKNVYSVVFHPNGHLVSGDLGGVIREWDISDGAEVRQFDGSKLHSYNGGQGVDFGGVRSLAISPDGSQLAAAGLFNASNPLGAVHDPLVLVFQWETGELTRSLETGDLKGVMARVVFVNEDLIAGASGGSSGGFLLFWNRTKDTDAHRVKLPHLAREMDIHSDGQHFSLACFDKKVHLCGPSASTS